MSEEKTNSELFKDKNHHLQIKRFLDDDGIERERHEYNGPLGHGFIDYEHKIVNGVKFVKATHFGPEKNRQSHDWIEVPTGISLK